MPESTLGKVTDTMSVSRGDHGCAAEARNSGGNDGIPTPDRNHPARSSANVLTLATDDSMPTPDRNHPAGSRTNILNAGNDKAGVFVENSDNDNAGVQAFGINSDSHIASHKAAKDGASNAEADKADEVDDADNEKDEQPEPPQREPPQPRRSHGRAGMRCGYSLPAWNLQLGTSSLQPGAVRHHL